MHSGRWFLALALLSFPILFARGGEKLIVHEWRIFTCLQDENGKAIGGINTDDQPVSDFVYNVADGSLSLPGEQWKGGERCHPDVTMRLETHRIYFYPPENFQSRVDVSISWLWGWITQYFPTARAAKGGMDQDGFGDLSLWPSGSAKWNDIALTDITELPASGSDLSQDPPSTKPATIESAGEHTKFLFCRGVANEKAPLRVIRTDPEFTLSKEKNDISELWLADVRLDGQMAFRVVRPFNQAPAFVLKTPSSFAPEEYSKNGAGQLQKLLHKALTKTGLFTEEADALLETLQAGDFEKPGMRLFFLAPRDWTLSRPWDVSVHARGDYSNLAEKMAEQTIAKRIKPEITRVTLGRIEIVTPQQRALLARIAAGGIDPAQRPLQEEKIPPTAQQWEELNEIYLQLGHFRNALVLDELKRNPTQELEQFIEQFHLQAYTPPRWWERRLRASVRSPGR